mgnify:CR=1 FL=1
MILLINSGNCSELNVFPSTMPFSVSTSAIGFSLASSIASRYTKIGHPIFLAFLKD